MLDFVREIFGADFRPHLFVLRGEGEDRWFFVFTSLCIAAALYAIALVLLQVMRKRKDIRLRGVFILLEVFFGLRATTQLLSVWTIFHPAYQLSW